jgi:trehalose transport system substrate-binding protein
MVSAAGRVALLAAIPAAILVLAGCAESDRTATEGPFSGTRIVFSISVAEEERHGIREVIGRFRRETGADVQLAAITAADLPEKLTVELAAGAPTVHLFAQDNLALRVLVDRGLVQPLDAVPIPEAVTPAMIPAPDGDIRYFLPFRPNVRVAYVNRARLEQAGAEPPRDTVGLRAVARHLRVAAGGAPKVVLPLAQGETAAVTICEWIVSFGGNPLLLNDAGSVQAFEFLRGLWAEDLLARESLLAKYDTIVDYLQGETAWLAQNWPFT